MDEEDKADYEEDRIFLCRDCIGALSDSELLEDSDLINMNDPEMF